MGAAPCVEQEDADAEWSAGASDEWFSLMTAVEPIHGEFVPDQDLPGDSLARSASAPDLLLNQGQAEWADLENNSVSFRESAGIAFSQGQQRSSAAKKHMARSASFPTLPPQTAPPQPTAAGSPRRVARSAEERRQRRLESNRAAAKRAYYRRQGKLHGMQEETDKLRSLITDQAAHMKILEGLLRQMNVDPALWERTAPSMVGMQPDSDAEEGHCNSGSDSGMEERATHQHREGQSPPRSSGSDGAVGCSNATERQRAQRAVCSARRAEAGGRSSARRKQAAKQLPAAALA